MPDFIIGELGLGAGSVRSVSLERDLYEPKALTAYMVTPAVVAALKQLGVALNSDSPQRAWKVVGPYGSGKSALGVAAGQLLAGAEHFPLIADALAAQSEQTHALFANSRRYPVALVGSRMSLGAAVARTLVRAVESWGKSKSVSLFRKRLNLGSGTYDGIGLNAAVAVMIRDFADAAATNGFHGVVLLVDELGKFVEHAALYPTEGDLMALQQLAESACGHGDPRLMVVAFLHQHISAYADALGKGLSDDWEKVASRFEEIPFDEPVERYAHFAAHTLALSERVLKRLDLATKARSLYRASADLGLLRPQSPGERALLAEAEQLYPLHPAVIAAMAVIAKRMGQSERSFHAFMNGDEPNALRDYATRTAVGVGNWYRLDNLWDHLADSHALRFRERNAERRWTYAATCIAREAATGLQARILKAIAVAELVEHGLRQHVSTSLIEHALDDVAPSDVARTIDELARKGAVQVLKGGAQVVIAVPEVANLDGLIEEAAREGDAVLITRALSSALSARPVVAHRHYDRTGTLRTLGVLVGTPDNWPQTPTVDTDNVKPDGWLKLLVVGPSNRELTSTLVRCQQQLRPLEMHVCVQPSPHARDALVQFAIWLTISQQLRAKQLDPWATNYVERQLATARDEIDRIVTSLIVAPETKRNSLTFWHCGKAVPNSATLNFSQLASWLFDHQFPLTPRVVNELINKDKPASAIVLARQRMFDVLCSGDHTKQICRETEFPPERLIHHTLLVDSGIWFEREGHWSLRAPIAGAAVDLVPVWSFIAKLLSDGGMKTFAEILDALAAPPLGVRAGPAGIWATLYLLINRGTCGIFERGTLILELTAEHLQRMYKAPNQFEIKELPSSAASHALLEDYRAALATVGCQVDGELTALEVARATYRWLAKLPSYSFKSGRLSKDTALFRTQLERSRDHIDLLFRAVPQLHEDSKSKRAFREWLADAFVDLGTCFKRLQDEVGHVVSANFEIAGSLSRVRHQLQKECSSATTDIAEANLRAFVLRCADPTLSDDRWLDSIASLIVRKPLDSWTDETLSQFEAAVIELCGQYKRWVRLLSHRARHPAVGERYVSLTMTLPSGHESAVFVVSDPATTRMAAEMLESLDRTSGGNRDRMVAALGQALLTLQAVESPNREKQIYDDQKAG